MTQTPLLALAPWNPTLTLLAPQSQAGRKMEKSLESPQAQANEITAGKLLHDASTLQLKLLSFWHAVLQQA